MQFGQRRGDVNEVDSEGKYLRNFKKGEVKVRFLEETDDWTRFYEHYKGGKSFPCTQDTLTCPGCMDDDDDVSRRSRKYGTNLWLVDVDKVIPFRIPVSLATLMDNRADRNGGSILTRDYVIMRTGKGLDTVYDADSDERYDVDTDKLLLQGIDINEILQASYDEVWGEPVEPKKDRFAKEEEPEAKPVRKRAAKAEVKEEPAEVFPSEADEADLVIDEDALYDMNLSDLVDLADKVGVEFSEDASKRDLIRLLLSEVGV
jgi:hypothetical protein